MTRKQTLPERLAALTPYTHDVEVAPGLFTNPDTTRLRELREMFWPTLLRLCGGSLDGLRVLDLGCNCGGASFLAEQCGAREVIGVDPHPRNIEQANAIRAELGSSRTRFVESDADTWLDQSRGTFDVVLLLGLIYHLRDPIGTLRRVGALDAPLWVIDAHVHYSEDALREDVPMWWMLPDNDAPARGGESNLRPGLSRAEWEAFVSERAVNYNELGDGFQGAPHSQREREFVRRARSGVKHVDPRQEQLGAAEPGSLVMVPNRKAIIELLRAHAFGSILELVPPRFAPQQYLTRCRVGFFALKSPGAGAPHA